MGSTAQVLIKDTGIYLYDHHGTEDPKDPPILAAVHRAFKRSQYASAIKGIDPFEPHHIASIIFQEMVKAQRDHAQEELNSGITTIYRKEDTEVVVDRFGIDTTFANVQLLVVLDCGYENRTLTLERWSNGRKTSSMQCSFKEFEEKGIGAFSQTAAKKG